MNRVIKKSLFNIPEKYSNYNLANVVIVPFGFEKTVTYGKGTSQGPAAIFRASQYVEAFDEELWQETYKKAGINVFKKFKVANNFSGMKKQLDEIVGGILRDKKIPFILGGEHSITPFILNGFTNSGQDDFSILQFDAHADLRDGYLGEYYSHGAAMRRSLDNKNLNLTQVGIRSISNENDELNFWKKSQKATIQAGAGKLARVKTFWAKDKKSWKINEIVKSLKKNVYLTFDVDAFETDLMPATGTPEPGGLDWYEVLDILRAVAKNKKIIGADFVELAPIKGMSAPDFLVAKLIYKLVGYMFR